MQSPFDFSYYEVRQNTFKNKSIKCVVMIFKTVSIQRTFLTKFQLIGVAVGDHAKGL